MGGRWTLVVGGMLLTAGVAGCQCCGLTEHYATAVDCMADHEHHLDVVYHPCYDLTRIGRPDWCQCGINRLWCGCLCDRCKPLPHIVDTTAADYVGMNRPWAESTEPSEDSPPTEATPPEGATSDETSGGQSSAREKPAHSQEKRLIDL